MESEGVQPHFPVPNEGLAALVHELDGILDREDVACLVAVDPIDHGRQGCSFADPVAPVTRISPFGRAARLFNTLGRFSCSMVRIVCGIRRSTIAGPRSESIRLMRTRT